MIEDQIRESLVYNPENGELMATKTRGKCITGSIVGSMNFEGYLTLGFAGKTLYAHRVAWLLYYGDWPKQQVDHFNRKRADNRIANLRDLSKFENGLNRENNTSGVVGVCFHKAKRRWRATIGRKQIGYFKEFVDAVEARNAAEVVYKGLLLRESPYEGGV